METTRLSSVKLSLQRGILFLLMRMPEISMKTPTLILKVKRSSKNNHDCENLLRLVVLNKQQRLVNLTLRTPIALRRIKLRWL